MLSSRNGLPARYRFPPGQTREVGASSWPKDPENSDFGVLDLALARIVKGADCWPPGPVQETFEAARGGAIAQLGERVVRNDEVGGSIPPGSTSLRSLRELRLGQPKEPSERG